MAVLASTSPTVIVTGAARGQGAAHVRLLAREGWSVVATDVRDADGEALAAECRDAGLDVRYEHLDVSDEVAWHRLVVGCEARGERVRGLVANAGVLRHASIADTSVDDWELQHRVNARGTFLAIRTIAPLIEHAGGGSIVAIASTAALVGSTGYVAYAASKAAILATTRVAAVELAPATRVNAICPGGVATSMNDDEPEGGTSAAAPAGRRASPEEISPLVSYLLSDASSFVTGSTVTIDGGLTAI